jgi:hypothetical protein
MGALSSVEKKGEWFYTFLVALFCIIAIVSNIVGVKLTSVPMLTLMPLPVGLAIYPLTSLVCNLVIEIYGPSKAKAMVWLGFGLSFMTYAIFKITIMLPAVDSDMQIAFERVFSANGLMLLSSLIAYLISQTIEVNIYEWIKEKTHSRHLWLRNNAAPMVAQIIDVFIVHVGQMYFALNLDWTTTFHIMLFSYTFKMVYNAAFTPLFYVAVAKLKPHFLNDTKSVMQT